MGIPNVGEILGVLVAFAIIFFIIRWFHKAYKNRDKNENVEKPQISDKDWIGETDEDWNKIDTIEERKKRSIKIPSRVKKHVLKRDKGICSQCGSKKHLEYEHIIPLSEGGRNTVGNVKLLCKACNKRK
ncbi:MAG: HNH endonuclease [Nitrospina sp.]|jgi:hypothetical protein|nr:HNH endonuclease [Nitrospina sp.]